MNKLGWPCFVALMLLLQARFIQANGLQSFEWNAFAAQSAVYSSDNNFLSRSDDELSLDLHELGYLFSAGFDNRLSFSAQVLSRKVSDQDGEKVRIDYGFFSYPLYQGEDNAFGIRVGRIRSSFGLYNDTRDIPHSRVGVVMPQSVYFDKTRNSFFSADGIELYAYHDIGSRRLSYQVFVSRPFADEDEIRESLDQVTGLEGKYSVLTKIAYGSEYEGPRVAITYYRPVYQFDIQPGVLVSDNEFYTESIVSSFEYNRLDWSLAAEYIRLKFRVTGVVPGASPLAPLFGNALYNEGYYFQGVYRANDYWDLYGRFDTSDVRRGHVNPAAFFEDYNLGARYTPDQHWLFAIEGHYVKGAGNLLMRDNRGPLAKYWNAFLFQLAYKW